MKRIRLMDIGILLIFLGSTLGDSEKLLVPVLILAAGCALVLIGKRRGEQNEQDN